MREREKKEGEQTENISNWKDVNIEINEGNSNKKLVEKEEPSVPGLQIDKRKNKKFKKMKKLV